MERRQQFSLGRRRLLLTTAAAALLCGLPTIGAALAEPLSVDVRESNGAFPLIRAGMPAAILIDANTDSAVRHVADSFAVDLQRLSGQAPQRLTAPAPQSMPVLIGVLSQSPLIDALASAGKIDAKDIAGQWEAFRQIVVEQPWPGVPRALVIVGADRRGAVFGTYDLSERAGVSPWYWFADAPVPRKRDVFIAAGSRRDQPLVKYRGFFINDEAPALTTWAQKHFGGANARMYAHVFELLLRLKGNYLWPAMWQPRAFNDDDRQNMVLADEMGVVMGTSHHEPMMRAHDEWHRNKEQGVTGGKWDYASNAENLRKFWRGGIERMMSKSDGKGYESLVTVGMRGDGDEAMAEDTATTLLEKIVADQRAIIAEVTKKPAEKTPQLWALYKEVQDYYDHGMKAPDDVTLLFADDNWGQVRRLPDPQDKRAGGFGVYYHFDYVGAPRNYKWLNTVQIEKSWQQMDLTYARGARDIWIVNVGDIKPVEYPLDFFLKQAWNPLAMTPDALERFPADWARTTFGPAHSAEIGALITRYSQLAARRKPELIDASSFHLGKATGDRLDGGEFGAMVDEWRKLVARVKRVQAALPASAHSAYTQFLAHPAEAMCNLYELYYAVAWNRRLAAANDPRANHFADLAEAAFARDAALTAAYHALNGGKWDGMMAQTHIGYTSWQEPKQDVMPSVTRVAATGAVPAIRFVAASREAGSDHDAIAIEATDFTRATGGQGLSWQAIPHLGRTGGAVVALPQGLPATDPKDGVRLSYAATLRKPGDLLVQLYLSPTLDPSGKNMLRIGVSIDDGPVQTLVDRLVPAPTDVKTQEQRDWTEAVKDNARVLEAHFPGVRAGRHVVNVWRIDDNVVLQKLVLSNGPLEPSYLGPPANTRRRG